MKRRPALGSLLTGAVLALGVVATVGETLVQPSVDATPPSWVTGPSLTGDWGGLRSHLADHGFAPYAIYTIEGFGAAGKGIEGGADWTSVLEFGLPKRRENE